VNDNKNVTTYYILDLDRTLFNTEKSMEVMRGVVAMHDPDLASRLAQQFEEYTQLGESFSVRDFIIENVGEEKMQTIEPEYHEKGLGQDLLNEGARELLSYIRAKNDTQLGILTYGSPLGQAMKINAAAGLEGLPFMVTSETFKGSLIATWRQDDDAYHLPEELGGFVTKDIIFVDDKPFSFKGLPVDIVGYLVDSGYDAGIQNIPTNVTIVDSLNAVIDLEKKRTASSQNFPQIDKP
jgi:hypothetical protein